MSLFFNCTNCGAEGKNKKGQWWTLSNYHGLSGHLCPDCYADVAHDSFGRPVRPERFKAIVDTYIHKRAIRRLKGNQ